MSARDTRELVEAVRKGAHFYMAHRMTEYPHPDAPEITMAQHVPKDENCPGCQAEAALTELAERLERAENERDENWHSYQAHFERAEAEAARANATEGMYQGCNRERIELRERLEAAEREVAEWRDDAELKQTQRAEAAESLNAELVEALEFYGPASDRSLLADRGQIARAALAKASPAGDGG